MTLSGFLIALVVLAVITQVGVFVLERTYPPQGQFIDVQGARLHVVELGPSNASGLPVVLIHGASSSLQTMRIPLGDMLAKHHRVILIDRPGLGWSTRERVADSTPAIQARMIDEALGKLGIDRAIFVGHSWAGAMMPVMALDYPKRVAGIVMLSPVAYSWPGGVGAFNKIATIPAIGPVLAYTITLPLGLALVEPGTRQVFAPEPMPDGYVDATAVRMVLRLRAFEQRVGSRDAEGRGRETVAQLFKDKYSGRRDHRRYRQHGLARHPFAAVRGCGASRKADRVAACRPHATGCGA